jgi:hypothetical protein
VVWLRRSPWIPGAVIALGLWVWAFARFDFAADAQGNIDDLWQSLGSGILLADPVGSIMTLHIQPPLLNTLFAVDLALTPSTHLFLAAVNLAAMVGSIALLVDALMRVGVGYWVSLGGGVLYAVLPGTVAYSLWVYNVTLTGLFAMTAVWGVAVAKTRPSLGASVSGLAVLGLVSTRSTFAFPILVLWVAALVWLTWRRRSVRLLGVLGAVLAIGFGMQLHYFANFGLVTMSSWGGQNVLNATRTAGVFTVSAVAEEALRSEPCSSAALDALVGERLNVWDPGGLLALEQCEDVVVLPERGVPAWDEQFRPGSEQLNFNWRVGLAASEVWTDVAISVVRGDPMQLVRMAVAPPGGVLESGVARYLSRSENYRWVLPTAEALPLSQQGVLLSTVFAPVAWLVMIAGWVFAAVSRRWRSASRPAFWFASGLLVFHVSASTLLEYAEAMRFRAEVETVLLFAATASVWWIVSGIRERLSARTSPDTSPNSATH